MDRSINERPCYPEEPEKTWLKGKAKELEKWMGGQRERPEYENSVLRQGGMHQRQSQRVRTAIDRFPAVSKQ